MSGPHNQVVAPGDIVYFRCHARGSSVSCIWHINDTVSSPRRHYNEKGFQFTDQQLSTGECNDTLMVTAHQFNNNTRIKCIARVYGQQDAIEVGNLLIAGNNSTEN